MNKTLCPICHRELNRVLRPDFLLCSDCQVAVRVSGTLAKELDRLNIYNSVWVERHSNNPIAHDVARYRTQVIGSLLPRRASVIDIGCGSGLLVNRLDRMGYVAFGIDWSEPAIKFARTHYQGSFLAADVKDLTPELLGFKFDCVVASHILEHLESPHEFLESVKGIMEPDGYLVIAVPNLDWWNPKSVYRSVSTIFEPEHVVGYSPRGVGKLLSANGYRVVKMATRTQRLAIMTAVGLTLYRKMFGGKGNSGAKSGYVKATGEGTLAKVLAWGMWILHRVSERRLRGMELIVVARKDNR